MDIMKVSLFRFIRMSSRYCRYCTSNLTKYHVIAKYLDITNDKAEHFCLKYPIIFNISDRKLLDIVNTICELGYNKSILIEKPAIFSLLPVTIRYRQKVLQECGFRNVSVTEIVSYLHLLKRKTIGELKSSGYLLPTFNVENQLASYMTQWPTSLTTLISDDINGLTLYNVRLKIIQRYLELALDLTDEEFQRGIQTYRTIKHRPLQIINETLILLQSQLMMPPDKIRSNLFLVHADPENLKHILYEFRFIGGIDVKEILRLHPKLCTTSYKSMLETRKVLQEYNISNEAQMRCVEIYTLSSKTVKQRLEAAKGIPEFQVLFNHPRFLKMIYYNKTAIKRMTTLYNNNKKCLSLNILSGSLEHYKNFEKAPGDSTGKGKDLLFCIAQALNNEYNMNDIRKLIKRHPFWINIPLVHIKNVNKHLSKKFSVHDIFINCCILLYPWNKIRDTLKLLHSKDSSVLILEQIDLNNLSNAQILSLVVYILEKEHYFSGNGVWTEEKLKNEIYAVNDRNRAIV